MFGAIKKIDGLNLILENTSKMIETQILGFHVIFITTNTKLVGQIEEITKEEIRILLVGEIKNNHFSAGVFHIPSIKESCRLVYKSELELIIGSQDYASTSNLLIGNSATYEGYKVSVKINDFFKNHFAVLGGSGTGKTFAVTSILQNIFYYNDEKLPIHSHFLLFDRYGEYKNAFSKINGIGSLHVKTFTTTTRYEDTDILSIPAYFLTSEDLALLLDVKDPDLITILEKAIHYAPILSIKEGSEVAKNRILASTLLDVVASGKSTIQMSDLMLHILADYNTKSLNLDTTIAQPGFTRTLRQCLNLDATGKMNALQSVIDLLNQMASQEEEENVSVGNMSYTFMQLYEAFNFASLSEGSLDVRVLSLKNKFKQLATSDSAKYFAFKEAISKEKFVKELFYSGDLKDEAQICVLDLSKAEEKLGNVFIRLFLKTIYESALKREDKGLFTVHAIIESAEKLKRDEIFEEILKEGRKNGVLLGLISQRPSELPKSALSNCANFLAFKLLHPEDLQIVKEMAANIREEDFLKIKSLQTGMALVYGSAFKVPQIVRITEPNPYPNSNSINMEYYWYNENEKNE